jgi:RHS repeat-associated protein
VTQAQVDAATNRFVAGTGVVYDAAGNITDDPKFRAMKYEYDAEGRMRKSYRRDDGSALSTSVYDGLGQRVQTVLNNVTTTIVYDIAGRKVAEYTDQAQAGGDGLRYVLMDHQGSTRVVTGSTGAVVARHDYLPFGEELWAGTGTRTAVQGYGATDLNRQRFALTERDAGTGLDHTWFRKHENKAGRWTSPDPYGGSMTVGDPQSLNRYTYTKNDPVNRIDPSGLVDNACVDGDGVIIPCEWHVDVRDDSRADKIISSRGADHGVDYGLNGTITLRDPIKLLEPQDTQPEQNKPCPPTGQQLADDPVVQRELNRAWRDSRPGQPNRSEQGGWIYARNGRIFVIRARPGTTNRINLDNPPQPAGALLVATFHTHPTLSSQGGDPNQSDLDLQNEVFRGVPGLIRNENGITPYGPNRRGSNPELALYPGPGPVNGYPGLKADSTHCPP